MCDNRVGEWHCSAPSVSVGVSLTLVTGLSVCVDCTLNVCGVNGRACVQHLPPLQWDVMRPVVVAT